MRIARFPANTVGRDLVVGDIHGHVADFLRLLKEAEFDPARDRVFCTGDLVDRGPDSMKCLALLQKPWFHCVAGNHEMALVDTVRDLLTMGPAKVRETREHIESILDQNGMGGAWVVRVFLRTPDRRRWVGIIKLINDMPNVIVVGEGDSRFHVVHGALFHGQSVLDDETIDKLETYIRDGNFSPETLESMANSFTWHRSIASLVQDGWSCEKTHEGLSSTFCGHNVVDRPTLALSHYHIDTGSGWQKPGQNDFGLTLAIVESGFPVKTLTTKERK